MKGDIAKRFQQDLLEWSEGNLRSFPWREDNATPYEVLIAEIMLKQTRSPTVHRIYQEFIEEYPTVEALAEADREELIEIIQPLGLYNYRADAFIEIGERTADGGLPEDEDLLSDLPQVGPYVLNATLCFGFGEERPIMDTNVERIYSRVFQNSGVDEFDEGDFWELAECMLPEREARQYNLGLLDFGYSICTHSSPSCDECFASEYCGYYQNRDDG
ncbi:MULTISPECIES: hypothetical protein [Halorubrum]|nr:MULTISPECIES: hypothetical protein [Halorubrum]